MRVLKQAFLRDTEVGALKNKATVPVTRTDDRANDVVLTATSAKSPEPVASLRPVLRAPSANAASGQTLKHAVVHAHHTVLAEVASFG